MEERLPALTRLHHKALEFQAALAKGTFSLPNSIRSGDHARRDFNLLRHSLRACLVELMMKWPAWVVEGDLHRTLWWLPVAWNPLEVLHKAVQAGSGSSTLDQVRLGLELEQLLAETRGELLLLYGSLHAKLQQNKGEEGEHEALSSLAYDLLLWLGQVEKLAGRLEMATAHCQRALELIPTWGQAAQALSILRAVQGRQVEAFALALRAATAQVPCNTAMETVLVTASSLLPMAAEGGLAAQLVALAAALLLHELRASGKRTLQIETLLARLDRQLVLATSENAEGENAEGENAEGENVEGDNFEGESHGMQVESEGNEEDGVAAACVLMAHDLLGSKDKLSSGQLKLVPIILGMACHPLQRYSSTAITWMICTGWPARVIGTRPAEEAAFAGLASQLILKHADSGCMDERVDGTSFECLLPEDVGLLGTAAYSPLRQHLRLTGPGDLKVCEGENEQERKARAHCLLREMLRLELIVQEREGEEDEEGKGKGKGGRLHGRASWEQAQRSTRLAQQRLQAQVQSMEAVWAVTQLPWTIVDGDTLLAHWQILARLVEQRRARLLLTMAGMHSC